MEIEQRHFVVAVAGHRIQPIQRHQVAAFQRFQRSAGAPHHRLQRQVGRLAPGLFGQRAHRQRLVGLAGAGRPFQVHPVRVVAHGNGAQLRQRAIGRADEGFQSLVLRVAQGKRQLRHYAHFRSGPFGASTIRVGLSMYESSTIAVFSPAYSSLSR